MTDFSTLDLAEPVTRALASEGYKTPTAIQIKAIPLVAAGRDVLGLAQTGTGKTAAFALPLLDRLARNPSPPPRRAARILILAPTRELASQIADSFSVYGRNLRLEVAAVFGGAPINKQVRRLEKGVHVLAATPGRLIDLVERGAVSLDRVETLVLDEADHMLDLGFIHALRKIVPMLPKSRQTLLFSATMPKAIAELARAYLRDPARVEAAPVASTAARIQQYATFVDAADKHALLARALEDPSVKRVLVFTRTKHGADRVVRKLAERGIEASAIHGNKSQPQRERALAGFRSGARPVLVATDIAARGIDVDGVTHVVNFELPNVPEQYVHRIGRTARAGAEGIALSFVAPDERTYLRDIEKLTRVRLEVAPAPDDLQLMDAAPTESRGRRPTAPRDADDKPKVRGASDRKKPRPVAKAAANASPAKNRRRRARRSGENRGATARP